MTASLPMATSSSTRTVALLNRVTVPVLFAGDRSGCRYYRCELPARVTGALVKERLEFNWRVDGTIGAYRDLGSVTSFQRPGRSNLVQAIRDIRLAGGTVWVELDDDVWGLSWHNPVSREWDRASRAATAQAIRESCGVTVSTRTLADVVRKHNRNVVVIENCIDPRDFPNAPTTMVDDGLIHVGWAGSWTHKEDLKVALPGLLDVVRQPHVRLHFYGYDPLRPQGDPHQTEERVAQGVSYTYHGWVNGLREHYANIARMHVMVAPLIDTVFNRSKSAIKWMESSIVGTAMVLSDVGPYREAVRHGETGMLAKNERDFTKYLRLLVRDATLRARIAAAARHEVLTCHTLAHRAPLWREIYVSE